MSIKKEYIALAVVILGLLAYILFKKTDRTHYDLPVLGAIEKTNITKIVISRASGEMTLQRENDRWLIEPEGYPADQNQIDRMLDAVTDIVFTSLVSESGNYTQYDLSDDKKIGLEVFTGDPSNRKIDIGKIASTNRHAFVRLEGDGNVYQARNNLRQPFDTETNKLRDKSVSVFDKEMVSAVSIQGVDGTLAVSKPQIPPASLTADSVDAATTITTPLWQTADGRAADEAMVDGILTALSNLRCDGYIEGKTKQDFTAPVFSITIDGAKPITLDIFAAQADKKYPAVSSQNDYPFLLAEWAVKRIMKTPGEIVKKAAASK